MTLQDQWAKMGDEQKIDVVRRMTANAGYLDSVLTNVMQIRAAEAGSEVAINWSIEETGPMIEMLAEEMRGMARNHPIETDVEPDLPKVFVDTHRLRQVITNLVVNAGKFAPTGTPITMGAKQTDQGVVVSVSDLGPGIPQDRRDEVFGKFMQMEPTAKGLGLGLFICRALMNAMGGDIWIAEGDEPGTTVCCLLPDSAGPSS